MTTNNIWLISVHTKHGVDMVLIKQEEQPRTEELDAIVDKFKKDFDLDHDDVYADIECGSRDFSELPESVEEYIENGY
jgi:hypothetical protein